MSNFVEQENRIAFHPGYYLTEYIEARNVPLADVARQLDVTAHEVIMLLEGKRSVSPAIAERLSKMTGATPAYWTNLQHSYDAVVQIMEDGVAWNPPADPKQCSKTAIP